MAGFRVPPLLVETLMGQPSGPGRGAGSLLPLEQAGRLAGDLGGCLRRSEVPDIIERAQAGVWECAFRMSGRLRGAQYGS